MLGFVIGVLVEAFSGQGILAQIGLGSLLPPSLRPGRLAVPRPPRLSSRGEAALWRCGGGPLGSPPYSHP